MSAILPKSGASVCVVMMSALGDAVHVLPVVNAIKRHSPASRLTWILEAPAARLMGGHPNIDEIIVHGKGFAALMALRKKTGRRRFDILIDLQVALKAGLATAMIPARVKLGFDRARARDMNWLFTNRRIPRHTGQHVQDQYLEFLSYLGVPSQPLEWKLGPWPGEENLLANLLGHQERPMAALAIATSRAEKDWIPSRWAEVADALHTDHGLLPLLVGGKSEKELAIASEIMRRVRGPVVSTLGCSLRELVGILHASSLVISPDTAPLHMSVALDVPVIALMGFTNPRRVGPYRKFHDLIVDKYTNPGEEEGATLEYRAGRMEQIQVGDVLERVERWKREYR